MKSKIEGHKKNGKWLIAENEISKLSSSSKKASKPANKSKASPAPEPSAPSSAPPSYSVEAFSKLTYLTEYGVKLWLKNGRLIAAKDQQGRPAVAAANLEHPHIKRLLR